MARYNRPTLLTKRHLVSETRKKPRTESGDSLRQMSRDDPPSALHHKLQQGEGSHDEQRQRRSKTPTAELPQRHHSNAVIIDLRRPSGPI